MLEKMARIICISFSIYILSMFILSCSSGFNFQSDKSSYQMYIHTLQIDTITHYTRNEFEVKDSLFMSILDSFLKDVDIALKRNDYPIIYKLRILNNHDTLKLSLNATNDHKYFDSIFDPFFYKLMIQPGDFKGILIYSGRKIIVQGFDSNIKNKYLIKVNSNENYFKTLRVLSKEGHYFYYKTDYLSYDLSIVNDVIESKERKYLRLPFHTN